MVYIFGFCISSIQFKIIFFCVQFEEKKKNSKLVKHKQQNEMNRRINKMKTLLDENYSKFRSSEYLLIEANSETLLNISCLYQLELTLFK